MSRCRHLEDFNLQFPHVCLFLGCASRSGSVTLSLSDSVTEQVNNKLL